MKKWLAYKIFKKEFENMQKVIRMKQTQIENLKLRLEYLNSELERIKINDKYLFN